MRGIASVVELAVCLALSVGCYSPTFRDCEITCVSGSCPAGFTCSADNVCRAEGVTASCSDVLADAGVDSPLGADSDGDSIPNERDNCPDIANPDQYDEDRDALGDDCDPCPPFPMNDDSDGDGVGIGCDPNGNMGGDRILLFVGFNGNALPASAMAAGLPASSWQIGGGTASVQVPPAEYARLMFAPVATQSTQLYVLTRVAVTSPSPSSSAVHGAGAILGADSPAGFGLACLVGQQQATGAPEVIAASSGGDANDNVISASSITSFQEPKNIIASRIQSQSIIACAADTVQTGGQFPFGSTATQYVGLHVRSASAYAEWLLVVERPSMP